MGGRAIGVLGALVMTRFLWFPGIRINDAVIITMTANWLTIWGSASTRWSRAGARTRSVTWRDRGVRGARHDLARPEM
jgi:hypothetical protein